MNTQQAQRMLNFLESFIPLALVPMNPDMYSPKEGCELDVEKVYSLSIQRGDEWLDDERKFSQWIKCEFPGHTWAARQHYDRLREAIKSLDGIRVVNYRRPEYRDEETPYILIDLTEDEHIRETF